MLAVAEAVKEILVQVVQVVQVEVVQAVLLLGILVVQDWAAAEGAADIAILGQLPMVEAPGVQG
jgi:hypothetical protein